MTTFVWRDVLTVSVNEMSRTQALECARQFDVLARVYKDITSLMHETDVIVVLDAPTVIKVNDAPFQVGKIVVEPEGSAAFELELPLTREGFHALPMSLTEAWIDAAVRENNWLIEALKKILLPMQQSNKEPVSDNGQSKEPSQTI